MLSQRFLRLSSFLNLFFFILLCFSCFQHLSSSSLVHSSASITLLLFPSSVFFVLVIVLFIVDCLFHNSFKSLLNTACIFLNLCLKSIHVSILFSRFLMIFTVIILNSLSGGLSNSSSFVEASRLLPCSFYYIFLCLFILFSLLFGVSFL